MKSLIIAPPVTIAFCLSALPNIFFNEPDANDMTLPLATSAECVEQVLAEELGPEGNIQEFLFYTGPKEPGIVQQPVNLGGFVSLGNRDSEVVLNLINGQVDFIRTSVAGDFSDVTGAAGYHNETSLSEGTVGAQTVTYRLADVQYSSGVMLWNIYQGLQGCDPSP